MWNLCFLLVFFRFQNRDHRLCLVHHSGGSYMQWLGSCYPSIFCIGRDGKSVITLLITLVLCDIIENSATVWLIRKSFKLGNETEHLGEKKRKKFKEYLVGFFFNASFFVIQVSWIRLNLDSGVASTKDVLSRALLIPPTLWLHQCASPLTLLSISALPYYYYDITFKISMYRTPYNIVNLLKHVHTHIQKKQNW